MNHTPPWQRPSTPVAGVQSKNYKQISVASILAVCTVRTEAGYSPFRSLRPNLILGSSTAANARRDGIEHLPRLIWGTGTALKYSLRECRSGSSRSWGGV